MAKQIVIKKKKVFKNFFAAYPEDLSDMNRSELRKHLFSDLFIGCVSAATGIPEEEFVTYAVEHLYEEDVNVEEYVMNSQKQAFLSKAKAMHERREKGASFLQLSKEFEISQANIQIKIRQYKNYLDERAVCPASSELPNSLKSYLNEVEGRRDYKKISGKVHYRVSDEQIRSLASIKNPQKILKYPGVGPKVFDTLAMVLEKYGYIDDAKKWKRQGKVDY